MCVLVCDDPVCNYKLSGLERRLQEPGWDTHSLGDFKLDST